MLFWGGGGDDRGEFYSKESNDVLRKFCISLSVNKNLSQHTDAQKNYLYSKSSVGHLLR